MKQILSILLIVFCFSVFSNAQGVRFGVNIDPQFSWLKPESRDADQEGNMFHVSGGLIIDNYFAENYAFSSGLQLGSQGGGIKYIKDTPINVDNTTDTISAGSVVNYKLQYITIPLNLKLKTNEIGYFTYYVLLGFMPQFNIGAHASSNDGKLNDDNISKSIEWFNLGYNFGGGFEYGLGEDTALTLGLIYSNGFLDVTEDDIKTMSRVLSIRVGIMF